MRIFRRRVEITAENAVPRLGAAIRTAFEWEYQADGRRNRFICKRLTSRTGHLKVTAYGVKPRALHHAVLPGSLLAGAIRNYSVAKSA